jgi:hypothetical protein
MGACKGKFKELEEEQLAGFVHADFIFIVVYFCCGRFYFLGSPLLWHVNHSDIMDSAELEDMSHITPFCCKIVSSHRHVHDFSWDRKPIESHKNIIHVYTFLKMCQCNLYS